jgi:single-strand DNA-binding protein
MSKGVNKVILVGRLGNDPEVRSFPDGSQVAVVSIATSESWIDKATGNKQERTDWHRVVLRDRGNFKMGGIAAQYLKKGAQIYVEGSLRTREYTDQSNVKRYVTEVIAEQMQMLDSKQDGNSSQQQYAQQPAQQYQQQPLQQQYQPQHQQYQPQYQQQAMPQQQQQYQQQPMQQQPAQQGGFDDFSDDIPF